MTNREWIRKSAAASKSMTLQVFAQNTKTDSVAWVRENLYACAAVVSEQCGPETAARMVYSVFEAIEAQQPMPGIQYLVTEAPQRQLTWREIFARIWATWNWSRTFKWMAWGAYIAVMIWVLTSGIKRL